MPSSHPEMSQENFTSLVDAYYEALYRFALSLARREADACDLVQQTFYVWATKGHGLRDGTKVKSWLFTTLFREFLRGKRRGSRMVAMEELPEVADETPALTPDSVTTMDAQTVMETLQEVDEVFRAPLTLFYLQDLSYLEIAEVLDVPMGTVMSRLSRGKAQLRAKLAAKEKAGTTKVVMFPTMKKGQAHG